MKLFAIMLLPYLMEAATVIQLAHQPDYRLKLQSLKYVKGSKKESWMQLMNLNS